MELVFALLMYLGDPPVLKEHLLMPSLSECMQRKRISMRSTNNAKFQCMKVNAVIKDGKIIKKKEKSIKVNKMGFNSFIFTLAHKFSFIYGIISVLIAISFGIIAGVIFRKIL